MTSLFRFVRELRTTRRGRQLHTLFIGVLALTLGVMVFAGPRLFAQSSTPRTPAAATVTPPAGTTIVVPQTGTTTTTATEGSAKPEKAGGEAIQLPFGQEAWIPLIIVLIAAILALCFGYFWWTKTMKQSPGSERMQGVAAAVQEGAMAYLAKQVKTMIPLVLAIGVGLFFLYRGQYAGMGAHTALTLGLGVAVAFVLGVAASYMAGYVGMGMAVRANVRVAAAALSSFKRALETAFQAGAVSGMFTVGLGLLGATFTFMVFQQNAMFVLVGFGFGGSLAALFMRVGGGIFTKAADVGADLVGKVEAGIPEDDPRNAATIADNVGDNVGDCAGMAADVFESYEVTLVAAIILAAAVGKVMESCGFGSMIDPESLSYAFTLKLVIYALLARAVGVVASIIGVLAVKGKDDPNMNPMGPINYGFWVAAIAAFAGFIVVARIIFGGVVTMTAGVENVIIPPVDFQQWISAENLPIKAGSTLDMLNHIGSHFWWMAALATTFGLVLTQVIGFITEHYPSAEKGPVTEIASAARTGPATLILSGLAEGLESSVWGILAIAATILGAYLLFPEPAMAAYAIALTGLGLLSTTGYVLAMDTYGPISDNANGIFEMSGALKNADGTENKAAHNIVARLDMVGNTTKALTKGFAIATAVVAAVALYRSFLDTVAGAQVTAGIVDAMGQGEILTKNIQVNLPDVFVGLLIGGAVPFLFSSFAIRAVSRAAVQLVEEVRRQFRTIPGIWEYTGVGEKGKPDYARCVAISTEAAQKELLGPGLLAVFTPVLVGFALGAYALGGFLAGAILTGQLMAVFMSNTGGAWDNAKKKIEDGFLGGKGSEAHKAGVIGDTVGDPLKDTAGPALNPMIKVMNLISILIAPGAVLMQSSGYKWLVAGAAFVILTGAVLFSKRGGEESATSEEAIKAK
jgi:K(+)-stimulated pyrophosphate-energized sodium pump